MWGNLLLLFWFLQFNDLDLVPLRDESPDKLFEGAPIFPRIRDSGPPSQILLEAEYMYLHRRFVLRTNHYDNPECGQFYIMVWVLDLVHRGFHSILYPPWRSSAQYIDKGSK
jgi:hypothetical protein